MVVDDVVLLKVTSPSTSRVESNSTSSSTWRFPFTSNLNAGIASPIPTNPEEVTTRSSPVLPT